MSRPRSLRRDLALGLSGAIVLLWTVATLSAAYVVREEMDETFDSALQETAERLLPLALSGGPDDTAPAPRRIARAGEHGENLTWVVRDAEGTVRLWSPDARAETFAQPVPAGFSTAGRHRFYAVSDLSGRWTLSIAEPLSNRREAVRETLVAFVAPMLLLLPLILALVVWRTRASLARLGDLSREVQGRDETDLRPLATQGLQVELLPLRDAVDRLMARLGRAIAAERGFTANAAHELRTPMAAALAQAQRLIAEAPEALRPRAERLEQELKRLARLTAKLLELSRAEGAAVLAETPQDLAPILEIVVEEAREGPEGHRLRDEIGALEARMDPDAFAILARNLIENALRHGKGAVEVTLGQEGLRVTNGGPALAPDLLARIPQRFARGTGTQEGSGLGLAIAEGITRGAGWRLALASPIPGRPDGFEARAIPPQPRIA
ncbi:histidine kinase dimerization/phospho-acceptor domain-containing protein [Cereibacter johrii]|uniref:histidine kinase dimerization/phospho-acceptor domain-containing protein n=1 Tax=Cereibacter johrii TaxID=445629 RepID=UPI002B257CC5|nr:histidine kinase dimerization/phospho-acceptor domain-containing protein [Cereibacter johrii]MEA5160292.1 histidine kinase dimerization/phospho-acceptor domain-containing protein [Cereibacter johrii]